MPESVVEAARAPAGKRKPEQAAAIIDFYRRCGRRVLEAQAGGGEGVGTAAGGPETCGVAESPSRRRKSPSGSIPTWCSCAKTPKPAPGKLNKRLTVVQDLTWALINSAGIPV